MYEIPFMGKVITTIHTRHLPMHHTRLTKTFSLSMVRGVQCTCRCIKTYSTPYTQPKVTYFAQYKVGKTTVSYHGYSICISSMLFYTNKTQITLLYFIVR